MAFLKAPLRTHVIGCRWFWVWALLGCAAALGFVSLGILVLAPAAIVGGLMASRPTIRRSAFGLLTGAGVLLLYIAWLQRAGPGTTCWQTATASGCDQHLNPLPWLIVGIACSPVASLPTPTAADEISMHQRSGRAPTPT